MPPVEVRGEAEDAGEWDWDALDVCTDADAYSANFDAVTAWVATHLSESDISLRDRKAAFKITMAKAGMTERYLRSCGASVRARDASLHSMKENGMISLAAQLAQMRADTHPAEMQLLRGVAFADAHGITSDDLMAMLLQAVLSNPAACAQPAAVHEEEAEGGFEKESELLLPAPAPSLLTPNASQHPDTDEIVYLLQHLGPWCDAGRSYPEAMGGLRALGGALRRRYSRGGARLLLQFQGSIYAKMDRDSVHIHPAECVRWRAVSKQRAAELQGDLAQLRQELCRHKAHMDALARFKSDLEGEIQAAGLWDEFLMSKSPGHISLWLYRVYRAVAVAATRVSSQQSYKLELLKRPWRHHAPPPVSTFVLDAQGWVRVHMDLDSV